MFAHTFWVTPRCKHLRRLRCSATSESSIRLLTLTYFCPYFHFSHTAKCYFSCHNLQSVTFKTCEMLHLCQHMLNVTKLYRYVTLVDYELTSDAGTWLHQAACGMLHFLKHMLNVPAHCMHHIVPFGTDQCYSFCRYSLSVTFKIWKMLKFAQCDNIISICCFGGLRG